MQQLSVILAGQFGLPNLDGTGGAGAARATPAAPPTPAGRGAGAPGRGQGGASGWAAATGRGNSTTRQQGSYDPLEGARASWRQDHADGGADGVGGAGIFSAAGAPVRRHPAVRRGHEAAAAAHHVRLQTPVSSPVGFSKGHLYSLRHPELPCKRMSCTPQEGIERPNH